MIRQCGVAFDSDKIVIWKHRKGNFKKICALAHKCCNSSFLGKSKHVILPGGASQGTVMARRVNVTVFNLFVTSFAQLIIDTWAVMGLLTYRTGLLPVELFTFSYAWSWIRYLGGWAFYVLILVGVFLLGMLVVNVFIHGWKVNNLILGLGIS